MKKIALVFVSALISVSTFAQMEKTVMVGGDRKSVL